MGLLVKKLHVKDFRSYKEFCLKPSESLTVLMGPNGVGKTNLIEALQVLTTTQSFRRPQWADLVRWGAESAHVDLEAEGDERLVSIELDVSVAGKREFMVNGKTKRRLLDVSGVYPSVVFTPEDLRLVKDSADKRRNAIDTLGAQLSRSYAQLNAEYDRIVRQRNALLRDDESADDDLSLWTEALITTGAKFRASRRRLLTRLGPYLEQAYENVAGDRLEAHYQEAHDRDGLPSAGEDPEEAIRKHLHHKRAEEKSRRTTVAGPHRDEIMFTLGGRDARSFASQGQQRTIALAWKLAEVSVITEISEQAPLLLLDDVMSELDERRRHTLASMVGTVAQTILTTTNIGYFDRTLIRRAEVVELG